MLERCKGQQGTVDKRRALIKTTLRQTQAQTPSSRFYEWRENFTFSFYSSATATPCFPAFLSLPPAPVFSGVSLEVHMTASMFPSSTEKLREAMWKRSTFTGGKVPAMNPHSCRIRLSRAPRAHF